MIPECPVCAGKRRKCFEALILRRYHVDYVLCNSCGLLQTEAPYWLEEAYSDVIARADTGLVLRNLMISRRLTTLLLTGFDRNSIFLDVAGGTGLLTRMMRDIGFDFYWDDPFCENVHAKGFEFFTKPGPYQAVTAFEVLEHLQDPVEFIREWLDKSSADTFIFTTQLYGNEPPPSDWWYYAHGTGQHVSFYQSRTLEAIADRLGLRLLTHAGLHMITKRKLSDIRYKVSAGKLGEIVGVALRRLVNSRTMLDHRVILSRAAQEPNETT